MSDPRTDELAANLADVQARIDAASSAAGRPRSDVHLVVVTKTWPAEDVVRLAGLGVTDVGENRDQEAGPKHDAVLAAGVGLRWHFIGQLQRNKARHVARYADVVESVDRPELALALAAARDPQRPLEVLIQVSLDPEATGRGGTRPEDVASLADTIVSAPPLLLRGVMAVAPLGEDPNAAFERLRRVSERLQEAHPEALVVSAGMSGDLEAAVRQGATHVRVGTAVLGGRGAAG